MRRELGVFEKIPLPPTRVELGARADLSELPGVPTLDVFDSGRWRAKLESTGRFRVSGVVYDTETQSVETSVKLLMHGGFWTSAESLRKQDEVAEVVGAQMEMRLRYEAIQHLGITIEDVLNATGERR